MKTHFVLLFVIIMLICNCGENSQESSLKLVINEIMALNTSYIKDDSGDYDDWIELYNASTDPIDIGGFYVSDNLDLLTKCKIDASGQTIILPDSFLVIWFDGQTYQGPLHVCCKLSGDGEDVVITEDDGKTIIDYYTYEPQTTDHSIGRSPDGSDYWIPFEKPTPGVSNQYVWSSLLINEILALNKSGFQDENDEYDDWVELYNAGTDTVDIGGFYVSDNLNLLTKCRIPDTTSAQTTILPDSFLVIWFDGETDEGPLHTCCKLTGAGEDVVVTDRDGKTIVDYYRFGQQIQDHSIGRLPDGSDNWVQFDKPTPGASNR